MDIFTTCWHLDSRESLAPSEHLSQDFAAFRLPFKDFFDAHQGRKKTPANRLCKKALRGFRALPRNADDNDLTEPGVDRLPPVSIAWRKR
jgi:hypothetical protein